VHCTIHYITRKSRGGIAVKEQTVEADILLIGRGNDCGVHLLDPRVLLHHAEVTLRSGDVYVAPLPGADVRLNGNLTQMTRVAPGDKISVGPYELIVEENDHETKLVISVELVQPLGDDLDRVLAQSAIRSGKLSARSLSWGFGLVVALALFAAPWIASWFHEPTPVLLVLNTRDRAVPEAPTDIWSTGGISAAHRFFFFFCVTCYVTPFVPVADQTCVTCHEDIEHHADPTQFSFASFEDRTCQNCHKEHQGTEAVSLSNESFCADCHQNLHERAPKSTVRPVSEFGADHPDFRPTIVLDSALHTVDRSQMMSDMPPPREDSSLKFPHNRHMRAGGVRDPVRGNVSLACENCHKTDGGGGYMLPISFEQHCHQCHSLKFDTFVPERELVHGKPTELFKRVRHIYDAVAMRGGYQEPRPPELIRRRACQELTANQKKEALDWSAAKTIAVLEGRNGRGLCEGCHRTFNTVASEGTSGAKWSVEPVSASNLWFPKSKFSHGSHRDMECGSCHDAKNSVESAEVLMPSIINCRACHGGEKAADKVPSTCVSCHDFHRHDLDVMKKAGKDGKKASNDVGPHGTVKTALAAFNKSAATTP